MKSFRLENGKRYVKWIVLGLIIIPGVLCWLYLFTTEIVPADEPVTSSPQEKNVPGNQNCNIAYIQLRGEMVTYLSDSSSIEASSEVITKLINQEVQKSNIKAIILEVDSLGGGGVAGEEVMYALKHASKPTVALIRGSGTSAAYLAATGADTIFASALSDVGSIGVTYSFVDNAKKNQIEGLTFNQISAGKFKDMGNPDKPVTDEEKELLLRDINISRESFIKYVSENRNLPIQKVEQLADGSSMLGEAALKNGLIDKIGGMFEVKEYLKEKIGEEVETCW